VAERSIKNGEENTKMKNGSLGEFTQLHQFQNLGEKRTLYFLTKAPLT